MITPKPPRRSPVASSARPPQPSNGKDIHVDPEPEEEAPDEAEVETDDPPNVELAVRGRRAEAPQSSPTDARRQRRRSRRPRRPPTTPRQPEAKTASDVRRHGLTARVHIERSPSAAGRINPNNDLLY